MHYLFQRCAVKRCISSAWGENSLPHVEYIYSEGCQRERGYTNEDNNLHLTSEIASTFLIIFLLYFQIYFYIFFWQFASWFSGLLSPFLFGKEVSRGFLHWVIFYRGIYLIWRFSFTERILMTCPLLQFSFLSHLLLA